MSRKVGFAALILVLFVLPGLRISSLEVGFMFGLGNLGFNPDRAATDTEYTGEEFFWGGSLYFVQSLSDTITLQGGLYRDIVLRNAIDASLCYSQDYLTIAVGTFNGLFNSTSTVLKPGISTSIQFGIPGVVFVQLQTASSIGGQLIEAGDYFQEKTDISFGFYVQNAICTLGVESKKFIEKQDTQEIVDSLFDYYFKTDIYQKNQPYRLILTLSYQTLAKRFNDGVTNPVHTLNSLILGTGLSIDLKSHLRILLNVESSIYTFGADELSGATSLISDAYSFRAHAGFAVDFAKLKEKRQSFPR